ncbi:hypothetical protein DXA92_04350 [Agathobaculum butyriciproducens]|nr:hypothetical protein DXA92_04350 [Agathobaculum butyriciproducens]
MLANQSDFMAYASALKSNYRKGVHRLETILSNPTMSAEFAANLGGVSVVLGVPISMPDRNSDKLLELLLGSAVADNAVETWLHQFYEFTDWDDLLSDSARCQEMANNPLIWRAAGGSKLAVGKSIATLAGLSCAAYKDIDAVAASQVAMAAVAASQVAMTAIIGNPTALNAVVTSQVAMAAIAGSGKARVAITNSSVALAALASSPLKKSVSTSAYNGNYAKLVTNGPCFIISATHNNSGWTFGVRYVYTSETASGAKTYSSTVSAQSINLFTTSAGLEAFANADSSSSGRVTFVYIPCKAA